MKRYYRTWCQIGGYCYLLFASNVNEFVFFFQFSRSFLSYSPSALNDSNDEISVIEKRIGLGRLIVVFKIQQNTTFRLLEELTVLNFGLENENLSPKMLLTKIYFDATPEQNFRYFLSYWLHPPTKSVKKKRFENSLSMIKFSII